MYRKFKRYFPNDHCSWRTSFCTPVKLELCELYLFDQRVVNQFSLAFIPIYLVSILPIYLHGTARPSRIKLNDATLKTRAICWMEKSVQSWHPRLVFFDYLITLSARASTFGEIVRPICLAAFRLMMNSNFVGCSTGRSAGFLPFKILSTYVAARRAKSFWLTP